MKTDVNTTMNQAKSTNDSVNVLQSQVTLNKNNIATNTSSIATNATHASNADNAGNSNKLGGSTLAQVLEQANIDRNLTQERYIVLAITGIIELNNMTGVAKTTGNVKETLSDSLVTYLNTQYGKFKLGSNVKETKFTTALGTSFTTSGPPDCIKLTTDYLKQHLNEFKSKFYEANPTAPQPMEIVADTNMH